MNRFWDKEISETTRASPPSSTSDYSGACGLFSLLSDDILLNILAKLESDPRDWARLACVCTRFSSLVRNVCCQAKCFSFLPSLVCDLGANANGSPGRWASLLKLSVCCPGLLRAGVLLENSDFGLEREIGPDENYLRCSPTRTRPPAYIQPSSAASTSPSLGCWSLFDDLYFDTVYDASEAATQAPSSGVLELTSTPFRSLYESSKKEKIEWTRPVNSHLASGSWSLSREQGSKLLASRFKCDSLYICDWPGCIHNEEKRNYMLFRGVFKNFKRSRVWKTLNDGNRGKVELECAFCACKDAWDLHSAFCLRTAFGFHDDGEPVVRAYVCENGHVSGAWTEPPMFS
ncbi:hypothetical protein HPP92_024923 [Vanilla planifolia]|uniref:F-box domain-containing protein n=1 Tax=Vanilla planifolia TaxID=51239 RepID=A0A835PI44_VANPL|nr:hypothetical protein HPP92_024923 [Vanilla planifolia]